MATNVYLIRHGQAYSNIEATLGGMQSDKGLTELGFVQAQALAKRLASGEVPAEVLYASTLLRARQTAEYVSEALKLPIQWDDELHELRPGDADGMSVADARKQFAGFDRFLHEAYTPIATGGESWGSFQLRAAAALERIIVRHPDQHIAVVAHGGIIEVSFMYFLELAPQMRARAAFHVRNTAMTHWRHIESPGGRREWQLVSHNDHQHLRDNDTRDVFQDTKRT